MENKDEKQLLEEIKALRIRLAEAEETISAELLESSELNRQVIESAQEGIIVYGPDLKYQIWNSFMEGLTGLPAGEVLGRHPLEVFPFLLEAGVVAGIEKALTGEVSEAERFQFHTKAGRSGWASEISAPLKNAKGEIVGVIATVRDITEHVKAEEFMLASAREWPEAFDAINDMITIHDADYNIVRANKAAESALGLTMSAILANKCFKSYHGSDNPPERCPSCTSLKTGVPSTTELFEPHLNKFVEIKAMPRFDSHHNVIGVVHVVRDITGQRKLEDQLRHAQKMEAVGTLAGGIAHDLNNILNVIMGYGSMVMDKLAVGTPAKEQMNEVLIAADRAATLTKRLLVFSRKQVVEVKLLDINKLILGVKRMLERIIREDINFNLDLAESPLILLADAGQIEQVLINLASNARDAMQEGGKLTISTELEELDDKYVALYGYGKPGKYALITVADTGHGMDTETQKKIFEPFFTTKGIGEGTGLGLAISYGIIKQHGGFINVYSEPGKGTVFKIYLPVSEEAAYPDMKTDADVPLKGGDETILVAEDDAPIRTFLKVLLESFGYTVITAEDGEDAITRFMENRELISLVLLDMIMPKKSGKEVREALINVSPDVKILFSSGYTTDIVKTEELAEGSSDFIHKPYQPTDLLRKVREILDK